MLNSPISWMGGKSRLRSKIIELIPKQHTAYIEVFGGAAWVLFGKEPSKVEVYNDINGELVNLFRVLKFDSEELITWIKKDIVSRELFDIYCLESTRSMTDIQRATRLYYIIKYSFASRCNNFGYSKTNGPNKAIFNLNFVDSVRDRLSNCYIENLSFEKLIEKYDSTNSFFFCDPPYYKLSEYKDKFSKEDHLRLRDLLSQIKGKFLLTINDCAESREWYKDYTIMEVDVGYSVSRQAEARKKYKELIIMNY